MSYGMRVWNESAVLTLDTNTFTYQVLGQWIIDFSTSTAANPQSVTLSIPGYSTSTCALILLPTRSEDIPTGSGNPSNPKCYPYVSVSANQAIIYARHPQAGSGVTTCRAILRAMAIRYA